MKKKLLAPIFIAISLVVQTSPVAALTQGQLNLYREHVYHYELVPIVVDAANTAAASTLTGACAASQIWNYFTETRHLAPGVAAGFLGNMVEEAHFEPRLVEYGWLNTRGEVSRAGEPSSLDTRIPPHQNDKGQPGYGIIQWTGGRKMTPSEDGPPSGLQKFTLDDAAHRGPSDLSLQLDFLWSELTGPYRSSTLEPLQALGANADPRRASEIITRHYEVPGGIATTLPRRQDKAADYFTQLSTGTTQCNNEGQTN